MPSPYDDEEEEVEEEGGLPQQKGLVIVTEGSLIDLLQGIDAPEELRQYFYSIINNLLPLSNLTEREVKALYFDFRSMLLKWLMFRMYNGEASKEDYMIIDQLLSIVYLQLTRSRQGFWSKLLAGSYDQAYRKQKRGFLSTIFGR